MKEENTHEKFFWIVGIGIIIFLVLLLGSIIGMKITRDNANKVAGIADKIPDAQKVEENYAILEDGRKESTNPEIVDKEIDVDGVRFSHFEIRQTDDEDITEAEIGFTMENMSEEDIKGQTYYITLYDSNDNVLASFSVQDDLPAHEMIHEFQIIFEDCIHAARIEVTNPVAETHTVEGEETTAESTVEEGEVEKTEETTEVAPQVEETAPEINAEPTVEAE